MQTTKHITLIVGTVRAGYVRKKGKGGGGRERERERDRESE